MSSGTEERGFRPATRPRKRRRHKQPVLLWVTAILLCILCYPRVQAFLSSDQVTLPDGKTVAKRTHDVNILLLGVDERNGDRGRSDTMMLLNYNAKYNRLHLISIPRDTRIKIPKHGYQKINAAYALGGPTMAKQVVGELTGLFVDYYLKVDFSGFSQVVDALGGVYIDVKTRMSYDDPYQDLHIHFEPGRQRLNGEQALEYVRWRGDSRSDLGRVERQRDFLKAALSRALSPVGLLRSPRVVYSIVKCLDTDIPVLCRPGLASTVALSFLSGMETGTVPGNTATIGDGSYFIADEPRLEAIIASWGHAPSRASAAPQTR